MKKFCFILVSFFCLILFSTPGYCFLDKIFKKGDPFERGLVAYRAGDYETAIEEFEPLAEEGNTSAQWNLYLSYEKENIHEKAIYWCTKLAKEGHADAQRSLGGMYYGGYGSIEENKRKAAYWYLQAAEQDDSWAQWRLGVIYELGLGVLKDLEKARQLYTKAAYQRVGEAQTNLASMYYSGNGGPKDVVQAYAWWSLYLSQHNNFDTGVLVLKDRLRKLKGEDEFYNMIGYKEMTPEEIVEAEKLTKQLYNKIYGELRPEN